ncbi:LLM class flavin-dependent oxidoreductase [Nocardia rhamnosiphila]
MPRSSPPPNTSSARRSRDPPRRCAGCRIDIVARHTEEAAWTEIEKGWASVDRAAADRAAQGDSVGAARIKDWVPQHITGYRDLEVQPNVWCGFSLIRGGPAFGLVGSYEQIAERLDRLIDLGVDAFILAGNPHLEEAYRVGEEVLPLLRRTTPTPVRTLSTR